jgi:hypothetical protein
MSMSSTGEVWKFIAHCPQAEQVYLVKERVGQRSQWLAMHNADDQQWELEDHLDPGHYRFRYFAVEGRTYFNCGSSDLTAFRVRGQDASVHIEPLRAQPIAYSA